MILFYAHGYSVTRFLVQKGGKDGHQKFTAFLKTASNNNWDAAVWNHYAYTSLTALQDEWLKAIFAEEATEAEQRKRAASLADRNVPFMPLAK